jgi:hypothetical protein
MGTVTHKMNHLIVHSPLTISMAKQELGKSVHLEC